MNRLAQEKSLYLRQHADNPVDWFPWGQEAFERAHQEDKPVLVSIGYSSCHWCHVMAHESFEDQYIAELMNRHFICIKVDREERPDVDQIYMEAVQMIHGHGGWPLNMFCLPDGRPFAGGTYFPPDDTRGHNIIPWPQLLMRVADTYKRQKADLESNAEAILGNLAASNDLPQSSEGGVVEPSLLLKSAQELIKSFDNDHGGFGAAPKFPATQTLEFLLTMRSSAAVDAQPSLAQAIDHVLEHTLDAMARGGLYDQIGGGFSRYCVDADWTIPHFEKMLYDNALLIDIYSKAFRRYPHPLYRAIVDETAGWLDREMRSSQGAYFSALDADTPEGEGRYYVWSPATVKEVLGKDRGAAFCDAYGIGTVGNFEDHWSQATFREGDYELRESFKEDRAQLLAARQKRTAPARDPKMLVSWNALLAQALVEAAFSFDRDDLFAHAVAVGEWIWNHMRRCANEEDPCETTRLYSIAYDDEALGNGHLDDYVHSAQAFLSLSAYAELFGEVSPSTCLERAYLLIQRVLDAFSDENQPGYFFTARDHEKLAHRKKDWFDNATPAGNSGMLHVLADFQALLEGNQVPTTVGSFQNAYRDIIERAPNAVPYALAGIARQRIGIAVVKSPGRSDLQEFAATVRKRPWRRTFFRHEPELSSPQLCVGTHCVSFSSANELADII